MDGMLHESFDNVSNTIIHVMSVSKIFFTYGKFNHLKEFFNVTPGRDLTIPAYLIFNKEYYAPRRQ
jgi:hypothetical protein